MQKEVAIMKKIRHQHLTKLFEVIDSPQDDKLFLVLEYVAGGQVMEWNEAECIYENERTGGPIEEDFAKKCTADMILGIEYRTYSISSYRILDTCSACEFYMSS